MTRIGRWAAAAVLGVAAVAWAARPATVRLLQEGLALEMVFDNRTRLLVTSKGAPLAPGTYVVKTLRLMKRDEKGRTWELRSQGSLSTMATLTVDEGQDKPLDVGEPILLDVWFWRTPETSKPVIALKFKALGRHSEIYYPGGWLDGKRAPPPKYRITSRADGRVLEAGQLPEPGSTGVIDYRWIPPKDFTGEVLIELEPIFGPFKWEYRRGVPTKVE